MNISDLAEQLGMTQSAVSHQLNLLKSNKMVRGCRDGKMIFYAFGKKGDLKEYHKSDIAKYKKIYENNFSYLKLLSEINYTKNNQRLTVLAIFISVIAIMVSVLIA